MSRDAVAMRDTIHAVRTAVGVLRRCRCTMTRMRIRVVSTLGTGMFLIAVLAACGGGSNETPTPQGAAVPSLSPPASTTAGATALSTTVTAVAAATATPIPPTPTASPAYPGSPVARIRIVAFGVDAAVQPIGLTPDNRLDSPSKFQSEVGWYQIYDRPGGPGNAVLSGVHGPGHPFSRLAELKPGDKVHVVMADGAVLEYAVTARNRYPKASAPMLEILQPKSRPANEQWITLLTSGGAPDSTGELQDLDVVRATRAN